MMDELELLKRDWQKQDAQLPKLTFDEIYGMIVKKSRSFVKWIFYICIAEFLFWMLISFIPIDSGVDVINEITAFKWTNRILNVVFYLVVAYFIYRFYVNFKRISATDNAKKLMKDILDTRKTVMRYVWFNLAFFMVMMVVVLAEVIIMDPDDTMSTLRSSFENPLVFWLILAVVTVGLILFFALLVWLFYRLLYGVLLKGLKQNYEDIKRLEF